MSNATLTLLGLYQYGVRKNIDLFDSMTLPEGVDHDVVKNNILQQCGSYEVIYPDFEFMQQLLELWSIKWKRTIEKWIEVEQIEYEPLDNYDRKEAWSDSISQSTSELSSTSASDATSESSSTNNNVSAFNSDVQRPDTSAAMQGATAGNSTVNSDNKSSHEEFSKHHGRIHGNIGVMTTQAIYREQWELVKDLNIYDQIMIIFAREFVIPFTY